MKPIKSTFYFNFRQGNLLVADAEGVRCHDLADAQAKALAAARGMFAADALAGSVDLDQEITILSGDEVVASVSFQDAVTFRNAAA